MLNMTLPPNISLVTGATGFVGRSLCNLLKSRGGVVRGPFLPHEHPESLVVGVVPHACEPLGQKTSWANALTGVDTVYHLAARVHILRETAVDPLSEFYKVNTEGTRMLALQAAEAGVRRFVFMSTIGVNGSSSGNGVFKEESVPNPHNPYAHSKFAAEEALRQIAIETGLEVVIIRAPLVYGPGNPGNFFSLLKLIKKGIPLPLASVMNRRSLIYVGNLVDALLTCAEHPQAVGNLYLVSDGEDVSTPELIRRVASALSVDAKLIDLPVSLIRLGGKIIGKSTTVNSLIESLAIDSSKIRKELLWMPPYTMENGLHETAKWFLSQENTH